MFLNSRAKEQNSTLRYITTAQNNQIRIQSATTESYQQDSALGGRYYVLS